jgi:hypothetical protein
MRLSSVQPILGSCMRNDVSREERRDAWQFYSRVSAVDPC